MIAWAAFVASAVAVVVSGWFYVREVLRNGS